MCDEYVVMPNHFHGILRITHAVRVAFGDARGVARDGVQGVCDTPLRSPSQTLGAIIRGFKSAVTGMGKNLIIVPDGKIWQRNYYEHVIRDANDLERIREYIRNNPRNWQNDMSLRT